MRLCTNFAFSLLEYHCGSDMGWSSVYWFKTPPPDDRWQPSLAIFGDMGNENAQSLARLQEETQRGLYDAILHVGDFAYDMDSVSCTIVQLCLIVEKLFL